jgi:hypothetical protein
MKSSLHSLLPFLSFLLHHLRLPSPELDQFLGKLTQMSSSSTELSQLLITTNSNDFLRPFETHRHGPRRKHCLFIVEKTCLLIRCLAKDVMLRVLATAGMCLPSRCLAMGLYVTTYYLTGVAGGLHTRVVNVRGIAYNTEP